MKKNASRRVGAESSATRHALLDAVEQLMLDEGYAAVTYRVLAARAGVNPAVVQYYFPTLDDLLLATIQRRIEGHIDRLTAAFAERPAEPIHVIWEFSKEEAVSGLLVEFTALANHRKSIRAEIARAAGKIRQAQIDALTAVNNPLPAGPGEISLPALVFILSGIPKLLSLDAKLGATLEHPEIIKAFVSWLDVIEPRLPMRELSGTSEHGNLGAEIGGRALVSPWTVRDQAEVKAWAGRQGGQPSPYWPQW